ncbi:MAG: hypothetical protein GC146_11995 [Limimaricola sp.]|uniref:hypothetical protein n=1 Tax=Limimaricola sp. TaxID=2211665 RepID=UPI001E152179|nr:hypothetical protein [Limimaricola sp.]MBI1417936.1 hypothetical protein [Limimaricola sp.]
MRGSSFSAAVLALVAGTVVLALPGRAGAADDNPVCGHSTPESWAKIAPQFDGAWTMEHLAGVAMFGPSPMAFPANQSQQINFNYKDGVLEATSPGWPQALDLRIVDEPKWVPKLPAPTLGHDFVSAEEFAGSVDCPQTELPRLIGEATVPVQGMPLHFTYRFMIGLPSVIYGFMHAEAVFNGVPITVDRYVRITR